MRADDLVDEHQMVAAHRGEIDGLAQLVGQADQMRPRARDEIAGHRRRETQDRGPEPHPAGGRRRDQQLLGFERGDDALHGRAREADARRDLPEAQACVLAFQRAQDVRRARDDLDLIFVGRCTHANRTRNDSATPCCLHDGTS